MQLIYFNKPKAEVMRVENNYGIVKVDYAGRFVIPAKLREKIGLPTGGAHFAVYYDGERISLSPAKKKCVMCSNIEGKFKKRNGMYICHTCYSALEDDA